MYRATLLIFMLVCGVLSACSNPPAPPAQPSPAPAVSEKAEAPASQDSFAFYVFGDNRPAKKHDPPTSTIQQIAAALKAGAPAFALSCGDLIYGKNPNDQSEIQTEYDAVLAILKGSGVTVHNAPGNHEMDDANDVPNATMTKWYEQIMGPAYRSFDHGNAHFVALNTEEVAAPSVVKSPRAETDSGSTTLDPGYVSPTQLQWLDADLAAKKSMAHVFLFMHHSIHAFKSKNQLDKASADALQAIIAKYPNVTAVFSAHEHLYFNPQSPDDLTNPMAGSASGPRYLVTGGAGAPLQKDIHGFYHYLIVTVTGKDYNIKLVKL